jgi:type II restriction/modification system DNA methylase subunit YeeA
LFERFLDPDKRAQIGAHYTDPEKIMMIVEPVVTRPLLREWETAEARIEAIMAPVLAASGGGGKAASRDLGKRFDAARAKAEAERDRFIDGLCALRILDPAWGSGNFLYLALQAVKDIEYRAILECETLGLGMIVPRVGPEILRGIEINPFAAELARTTIWIGDIQWRVKNAITHHPRPILRKLDTIECRDALLTSDGKGGFVEAAWPEADFIVGNPPFLGDRKMIAGLGENYVVELRSIYRGLVPGSSDLVCYWFQKGLQALNASRTHRVGFVATNSITGGNNLPVVKDIVSRARIFEAWSDQPWTIEGAAVRVSIICFHAAVETEPARLDRSITSHVGADLSAGTDIINARKQSNNVELSFIGTQKNGPFDISGQTARLWLKEPLNPNARPNSDVVLRWSNGQDITRRPSDTWIIDFGTNLPEAAASFYEAPFKHVLENVKPTRELLRRAWHRNKWWLHGDPRPALRRALKGMNRFIITPRVSKHRLFAWADATTCLDSAAVAIARDDDTTFGILHSRFHEAWSLRLGTWLGVGNDPRYTPTTTFETFPFPEGLTPNLHAAAYADDPRAQKIAAAAKRLDELRRARLNPPDLVDIVPEIIPTAAPGEAPRRYPDRIVPKNAEAAVKPKERTLTNLYNLRPRWLADAHDALDRAVASAYGWAEDISTEDALQRLLALNLERAAAQGNVVGRVAENGPSSPLPAPSRGEAG